MLNYLKAYALYPTAEKYLKRDIRSKLSALKDFEKLSSNEKNHQQKNKLYNIIAFAGKNVPYYQDLFKKIHFNPENILKSVDYINEIPLLTKEILREEGLRLVNQNITPDLLNVRKTNGSTGLVTYVYYDAHALDWTAAANLFASEMGGRDLTKKEVHLVSELELNHTFKSKWTDQLKCLCLNRKVVQTKHFDANGLKLLLDQIKELQPYSIQGHPSTLYYMAIEAQKYGTTYSHLFTSFESTGESIDKHKVEIIEKSFNCKVYNRYGNAEFGVIAHSTSQFDVLKIFQPMIYAESHSLGNGLDELVLTGLTNFSMPLIRYKTGDVGHVLNKNSDSLIHNLNGRFHDVIQIGNNSYPSHFIKDVLENIGGVDEFQIVQKKETNELTLKLVPSNECNKVAIENAIEKNCGLQMKIEWISFEGLIMQGWRDKFKYVVRV